MEDILRKLPKAMQITNMEQINGIKIVEHKTQAIR
jgi:hypothetical protein